MTLDPTIKAHIRGIKFMCITLTMLLPIIAIMPVNKQIIDITITISSILVIILLFIWLFGVDKYIFIRYLLAVIALSLILYGTPLIFAIVAIALICAVSFLTVRVLNKIKRRINATGV
ncbi:MAG: hypothetical protein JZD41_00190 [Thermoproteus sp.]|nr:hypothetical protein [Thermoproteus sp.]